MVAWVIGGVRAGSRRREPRGLADRSAEECEKSQPLWPEQVEGRDCHVGWGGGWEKQA